MIKPTNTYASVLARDNLQSRYQQPSHQEQLSSQPQQSSQQQSLQQQHPSKQQQPNVQLPNQQQLSHPQHSTIDNTKSIPAIHKTKQINREALKRERSRSTGRNGSEIEDDT